MLCGHSPTEHSRGRRAAERKKPGSAHGGGLPEPRVLPLLSTWRAEPPERRLRRLSFACRFRLLRWTAPTVLGGEGGGEECDS